MKSRPEPIDGENILVYRKGDDYYVRGAFSGEALGTFRSACEAVRNALASLRHGGELRLGPGEFEFRETVALTDDVQIRGSGRATRLRCNHGPCVLSVTGNQNVEISNLSVVGSDRGVPCGVIVDDSVSCQLDAVLATGFIDCGLWLRNNAALCSIRGCSAAANVQANIRLQKLARGRYGDYLPTILSDTFVFGGGTGFEFENALLVNVVGCVAYQTSGPAYHLCNKSNSVAITGCRSFQIGTHALLVEDTCETCVTGNIFCWHVGHGILFKRSRWGTITGNEIIDSGSYNAGGQDLTTPFESLDPMPPLHVGVDFSDVRGVHVVGNAIFNWPCCPRLAHGIREDATSRKNAFVANNINHHDAASVIASAGEQSVKENNVSHADNYLDIEPKFIQSFRTELIERLGRELATAGRQGPA